jgi:hypothetical protein
MERKNALGTLGGASRYDETKIIASITFAFFYITRYFLYLWNE